MTKIRAGETVNLVRYRCPRCGYEIDALPHSRLTHHCRENKNRETAFVVVEEGDG